MTLEEYQNLLQQGKTDVAVVGQMHEPAAGAPIQSLASSAEVFTTNACAPSSSIVSSSHGTYQVVQKNTIDPSQLLSVAIDRAEVLQGSNATVDNSSSQVQMQTFMNSVPSNPPVQYQTVQFVGNETVVSDSKHNVVVSQNRLPKNGQDSSHGMYPDHVSALRYQGKSLPNSSVQSHYVTPLAPTYSQDLNLPPVGNTATYSNVTSANMPQTLYQQVTVHEPQTIRMNIDNSGTVVESPNASGAQSEDYLQMMTLADNSDVVRGTDTQISTSLASASVEQQDVTRYIVQVGRAPPPVLTSPAICYGQDGRIIIRSGCAVPKDEQIGAFLRPLMMNSPSDILEPLATPTPAELSSSLPVQQQVFGVALQENYLSRNINTGNKMPVASTSAVKDSVMKHVQINSTPRAAASTAHTSNTTGRAAVPLASSRDIASRAYECTNCCSKFLKANHLK